MAGNRVTLNLLRFLGTFPLHLESLSLKLTSSKSDDGDSGLIDVKSSVSEPGTSFAECLVVASSGLVHSSKGESFLGRRRFTAGVL